MCPKLKKKNIYKIPVDINNDGAIMFYMVQNGYTTYIMIKSLF